MYHYTIVCFDAEIGYGVGETLEYAKQEAEEQAIQSVGMYPVDMWEYIAVDPTGHYCE